MTPKYNSWIVESANTGVRLDVFLQKNSPDRSRSEWARLIEDGCIFVNSKKSIQRSYRVQVEDEITFDLPQKALPQVNPVNFQFLEPQILFEDKDLMVVNKPEGLAVHAGHGIPFEKTLSAWLLYKKYCSKDEEWPDEIIEEARWGIVHRLDMTTSGAMIVAKNPQTHRLLSEAFKKRSVHRRYFAISTGSLLQVKKHIPALLDKWCRDEKAAFRLQDKSFSLATQYGRDPTHPLRMSPLPEGGKRAITHGVSIFENSPHSLIELKLQTGRTHQIRSHLRFLGLSIVGDELYGGQKWKRILLHSHTIRFEHPTTKKEIKAQAGSESFFEACLQLGIHVPSSTDEIWKNF